MDDSISGCGSHGAEVIRHRGAGENASGIAHPAVIPVVAEPLRCVDELGSLFAQRLVLAPVMTADEAHAFGARSGADEPCTLGTLRLSDITGLLAIAGSDAGRLSE